MSDIKKKMGKSIAFAEEQRDTRRLEGFAADLFRGKANFDLLDPWYTQPEAERQKVEVLAQKFENFLTARIDPDKVDRTDELPPGAIDWLSDHGFFALKNPKKYDGHELSQTSYNKLMGLNSSWCGGITALLSANNTIGVGFPLKKYGTPEQKERFLKTVGKSPSGFSFTEEKAGSDPSSMEAYAVRIRDADGNVIGYEITGEKWWTTNAPLNHEEFLAPYLCVVVKTVDKPEDIQDENYKPVFSAFFVPTDLDGVGIKQRCKFQGLRGMYNGIPLFNRVYVPKNHLIGEKEGTGFRIGLEALNTGRISIAASCTAISKQCLLLGRWWGKTREQWGKPLGYHELLGSGMLASGIADTLAMEAMVNFTSGRLDQGFDTRLEAAICKVFASERGQTIVDNTAQIFGGRGYETASSLARRGEPPLPVERTLRDFRPERIFEGPTEVLELYVVREGTDKCKRMGETVKYSKDWGKKLKAAAFFPERYLLLKFPRRIPDHVEKNIDQKLYKHAIFVEKNTRKFARAIIATYLRYRTKLMHKQLVFDRLFWIAAELNAMSMVCLYGTLLAEKYGEQFIDLANFYCYEARNNIYQKPLFKSLKKNNDALARKIANALLDGAYDEWLKEDIISFVHEHGLLK
ncbi:acyl-CoA/acyl-ACP dehydrogenase [Patescibacteria group bacterium AH-259-L05]|nr:acyl-CoA/acyl-ACP dehydrogenase [Patescibacteria group bacterium AH-259-L05]